MTFREIQIGQVFYFRNGWTNAPAVKTGNRTYRLQQGRKQYGVNDGSEKVEPITERKRAV